MKKSPDQKTYSRTYRDHLVKIVCEKRSSGLWWASVTITPNKGGVRSLTLLGPYKPTSSGFDKPAEAMAAALEWARDE